MTVDVNMARARCMATYSRAVLAVRLEKTAPPPEAEALCGTPQAAARAASMAAAVGKQPLIVLGAGDGTFPAQLHTVLQGDLLVLEQEPEKARALLDGPYSAMFCENPHRALLTDNSPWALAVLCFKLGLMAEQPRITINPLLPRLARQAYAPLKQLLDHSLPQNIPTAPETVPNIALAAILHPNDTGLEEFFAAVPSWVSAVHCVWDAPGPGAVPPPARTALARCAAPVFQLHRELGNDFSAQRNHVLDAVRAAQHHWVLFLDADERLAPPDWNTLAALTRLSPAAWAMPRQTFYPDADHVRIGYGLWPDIQLRFFRMNPQLRFERPVHERMCGIEGQAGLVLRGGILHESYLLKDTDAQNRRLATFDQAAGQNLHRLNVEYPHLDSEFFSQLECFSAPAALLLPGLLE